MMQSSNKTSISRELARKLLPLSLSIFPAHLRFVIPGAYGFLEFKRLEKEAGTYARQLAEKIKGLAAVSPGSLEIPGNQVFPDILDAFCPIPGVVYAIAGWMNKPTLSINIARE